ncbi:MAG: hypothetical protein U0172_12700 [Nitrospiraceae bacterium]
MKPWLQGSGWYRVAMGVVAGVGALSALCAGPALAEGKGDRLFHAVATDAKGVETDVKNVVFYWEEKISETSFVPHELREVPVKRGTATVKIKFDNIKQIDLKPSGAAAPPNVAITLNDGKSGDFTLAVAGSFKGQSDFGEVELPAAELKKLTFK